MKNIILTAVIAQTLYSSQSMVEAEKLQDNYQYTTQYNICVLEKVEKKQKKGSTEDYLTIYDEATSECSYEYAKRIYRRYRL